MKANLNLRPALILGLVIVFATVILAISWRVAYPYMRGPVINSYEYIDNDSMYTVRGTSTRAKVLKVQGRQVTIDSGGAFHTDIIKLYPYTILIIEAYDRFGHSIILKKEL